MIVVTCPVCGSNDIDLDDSYDLDTDSCIYFKCNHCDAIFDKSNADYENI